MAHFGSVKYTYSKAKPKVITQIRHGQNDETLDNSIWKDSFDKLLEGNNRVSNPNNVLKNIENINASYNRNSSLDTPKLSKVSKKNNAKGRPRRRKKTLTFVGSEEAVISTPKGRSITRLKKLKFHDISPISEPTPPPLDVNGYYRNFFVNSRTRVSLPSFSDLSTLSPERFKRKKVSVLDVSKETELQLNSTVSKNLMLTLSLPKNEEEKPFTSLRAFLNAKKCETEDEINQEIVPQFQLPNGHDLIQNTVEIDILGESKGLNDNALAVYINEVNETLPNDKPSCEADSEYYTSENNVDCHETEPPSPHFLGFSNFYSLLSKTGHNDLIGHSNIFVNRRRRTRQSPEIGLVMNPIQNTHITLKSAHYSKLGTPKSKKNEEILSDDSIAHTIVDESSVNETQECKLIENTINESGYRLSARSSKMDMKNNEKSSYITLRRSNRQSKVKNKSMNGKCESTPQKIAAAIIQTPEELKSQSLTSKNVLRVCDTIIVESPIVVNPVGQPKKKTVQFSQILEENPNNIDSYGSVDDSSIRGMPITLRPGKWRKSLLALKRRTMSIESSKRRRCSERVTTVIIEESEDENSIHHCKTLVEIPKTLPSQVITARDVVLRHCKQTEPMPFDEAFPKPSIRHCHKIGEGVYSEVFINRSNITRRQVVLKIIPIEGALEVNGETQKKFEEILSEIVITKELSDLRRNVDFQTDGFVEAMQIQCVAGKYPEKFINLWETWNKNGKSENDHPNIFEDNQLYIVLELANAGQDLEAFKFQSAKQSYSTFVQVSITLAIAEKQFEFEHRDLHWGNILLSSTKEKEVTYRFAGKEIIVPTHGVRATIIDFTLSRMVVNNCRHYNDLACDDELFAASGDYQFDIYRKMKTCLENQWERFEPHTNVLWLHYVIDKMINGVHYKNKTSAVHREAIKHLTRLHADLLNYSSASSFIEDVYHKV